MAVAVGSEATLELVTAPKLSADQMGNPGFAVLSTPALVQSFEAAAIKAISAGLTAGEGSVGTFISVRHLAATPVGMHFQVTARVKEVEGRRVVFTLQAHDDKECIGEGEHERFVIDRAKFLARIAAKSD